MFQVKVEWLQKGHVLTLDTRRSREVQSLNILIDGTRDSQQKMIKLFKSKNYWFGRYFDF